MQKGVYTQANRVIVGSTTNTEGAQGIKIGVYIQVNLAVVDQKMPEKGSAIDLIDRFDCGVKYANQRNVDYRTSNCTCPYKYNNAVNYKRVLLDN